MTVRLPEPSPETIRRGDVYKVDYQNSNLMVITRVIGNGFFCKPYDRNYDREESFVHEKLIGGLFFREVDGKLEVVAAMGFGLNDAFERITSPDIFSVGQGKPKAPALKAH